MIGHLCLLIVAHGSSAPTLHRAWNIGVLSPLMITFQSDGSQVLNKDIHKV